MRARPFLVLSLPSIAFSIAAAFGSPAHALDPFTDGSSVLNDQSLTSGVAIGIEDMNADGLDDIIRLHDTAELAIEYQQEDGSYTLYDFGPVGGSSWGLAIGDVDENGFPDIFTGGAYDGLKVLRATDDGTDFDLGFLDGPDVFVQCVNFADIDNNGTLDLFVCNDDSISAPFNNDGTGEFTYDLGLISAESTVPSDNSGNYGTVWMDYDNDGDLDLYIAKCRLGINDPMDGRRLNLLFQNDGSGNYTDVAEAAGIRPLAQSWSIDFADIDNDGDLDAFLVTHDQQSDLYENLGPGAGLGTFADITPESGMGASLNGMGLGIQAHFEDFDNDTLVDLLVTGRSGEHRLFINNGDKTFTAEADPFPTGNLGIQSAAVGDLDDDGFPDIIAGFATGYNQPSNNADRVFINPGNDNNWINIKLHGVESNASAVGARVEITGKWGTQIREVRAGESYGINNSSTRHFGLGAADAIESVTVRWPSGHVDTGMDPPINGTVHITEGCPDTYYPDTDGDGYGDGANPTTACFASVGFSADATDCDDAEGASFPGNPEICDGLDNDCDGTVDNAAEPCAEPGTTGTGDESSGGADDTSSADGTMTGVGPTTLDPTNATGDDGCRTGGPMEMGDSGGCGCVSASSSGSSPSWLLLPLFGVAAGLRRRRR
jgi:MYXO-CTERM domain-containing protein